MHDMVNPEIVTEFTKFIRQLEGLDTIVVELIEGLQESVDKDTQFMNFLKIKQLGNSKMHLEKSNEYKK